MKNCVVAVCVLLALLLMGDLSLAESGTTTVSPVQAQFDKVRDICMENEKVALDEYNKFLNGTLKSGSETQNIKCMQKCVFERTGILRNGLLMEDVLIETLSTARYKDFIQVTLDNCKDIKGVDDCDTAFELRVCFMKYRHTLT